MSKKNYSSNNNSKDNKDANRHASAVPTNPVDAPIHGTHARSSADKARHKAATTGLEARKGSSQSGPRDTMSKPCPTEIRGLSRSVESATGGSADKSGSVLTKTGDHEDVDSDELELDSDLSADNASWRKIAKNFAIKPSDLTLPKMRFHKLQDQIDFRDGYQMVKPAAMHSWEQIQAMFEIPEDLKPSVADRNAKLNRKYPDIQCDFKDTDFL